MVSIIVPVYNAEKYLSSCIESILNQTYSEFELFLINDGSSDSSGEICDFYAKKDERIKVIHNENHGVSYTRNNGLQLAKGEYIIFCDADDQYKKDYIMKMLNAVLDSNADLVICNYSYLRGISEKPICNRNTGEIDKNEVYQRIFIDNTIGGFVWNKLFKKSLLNGLNFDEHMQICEDTYFLCSYLKKANKIYYLGESLYLYRLHLDNTIFNIQNMFDINGNLKYAIVYEKMLADGIIDKIYAQYVKANECVLAISVKCDYLNSEKNIDKNLIKKLNTIIKYNLSSLLTCKQYSLKKKIICIGNTLLNLRRFKKIQYKNM